MKFQKMATDKIRRSQNDKVQKVDEQNSQDSLIDPLDSVFDKKLEFYQNENNLKNDSIET